MCLEDPQQIMAQKNSYNWLLFTKCLPFLLSLCSRLPLLCRVLQAHPNLEDVALCTLEQLPLTIAIMKRSHSWSLEA